VGRKRIALTMKSGAIEQPAHNIGSLSNSSPGSRHQSASSTSQNTPQPTENAFAAALRRAKEQK
jgi:hypothetical protein